LPVRVGVFQDGTSTHEPERVARRIATDQTDRDAPTVDGRGPKTISRTQDEPTRSVLSILVGLWATVLHHEAPHHPVGQAMKSS
jgi:hypothetical protein